LERNYWNGSIVYRDIPEEMRALIEPIVDDYGLELVDADLKRGRAPWTLRVIVDRREGDGLVPVEDCARVSREIGSHLDARDLIPTRYTLEVSSPGLDRVLAREKDFSAACGREVKIETRVPRDGRRRFRGRLIGFEDGIARLLVEGREIGIAFDDVAKAKLVYEFTREDFSRRASR
jgi:ribosome maturation factor RimP